MQIEWLTALLRGIMITFFVMGCMCLGMWIPSQFHEKVTAVECRRQCRSVHSHSWEWTYQHANGSFSTGTCTCIGKDGEE